MVRRSGTARGRRRSRPNRLRPRWRSARSIKPPNARPPMPELPEVETILHHLDREISGRKIKTVEVTGTRSVRRGTKKEFISRLEGTKITGVKRRGKFLLIVLDSKEWLRVSTRQQGH